MVCFQTHIYYHLLLNNGKIDVNQLITLSTLGEALWDMPQWNVRRCVGLI